MSNNAFDFPMSSDLQNYIDSCEKFSQANKEYYASTNTEINTELSKEDLEILQLQITYCQMHSEVEKLRELLKALKFHSPALKTVSFLPKPMAASPDYPICQSFDGYTEEVNF